MLRRIIAAFVTIATLTTASIASADYAAIAFSQSTGNYGYSYGYGCRAEAESAALDRCPGDDSQIVVWTQNGWCALAVGEGNAYGWGWASCQAEAERLALENCSGADAHVVSSVLSGTD